MPPQQDATSPIQGHGRGTPAYRRLTLAMLFAGFATFSLLYSAQPLLPLLAHRFTLSAEAASLAVSMATGPLAIGILVAGFLSDAVGRRSLMAGAMISAAVLGLLTALAPNWAAFLVLRTATGIVLAGVPAVAMAYVAEEVEASAVAPAMGLYIAGSALGGMGGRLIASLVAAVADWRAAIGVVGVVGLLLAEGFRRLAPASRRFTPKRARVGETGALLRDPALLILFAESFLLMGVLVTVYNYVAFRLLAPPYSLSQAAVGAVFLLYIIGSASSAWFGSLAGRVGQRRVFWVAVTILSVGVAVTAARPLPLVVAGIALLTGGFFGAHSIASAWVSRRALDQRGGAASLYLFFYYLGSSVLGSAGGIAWTHGGWSAVTWFCLGLCALALLGAGILCSNERYSGPCQTNCTGW